MPIDHVIALTLMQALFDYRPQECYRPVTHREPPHRDQKSRPGIGEMLSFAAQAQRPVQLDDRTVLAVRELERSHAP